MKLFFDSETTGKADFRAPASATHQPRIVQLGALLTSDEGDEISSINLIIKPRTFEIPAEASAIHGITTGVAKLVGVEIEDALTVFLCLWNAADTVVAHNKGFDLLMLDIEAHHWKKLPWDKTKKQFCTMSAMTPICKLPGNYGDWKWPKLQEAHKHAFGVEFDGAHDAMADVRACAKVYFWLLKRQQEDEIPMGDPALRLKL